MPKVSIVLPTYNGEKYLRESIESIVNQSFEDWELIIVNDCSTDSTSKIIYEYAFWDRRIKVIENQENQKLPKSLNIGFRYAAGEYLTWTSDDNYYLKDALSEMNQYLDEHMDIPMVVANYDVMDENEIFMYHSSKFDNKEIYASNLVGACFMYRRSVLDTVGEYDPDMFLVEDYDYWMRIVMYYGNIGHLDKMLYKYRIHKNSLTSTKQFMIKERLCVLREKYIKCIFENLRNQPELLCSIYYEFIEANHLNKDISQSFLKVLPELRIDQPCCKHKKIIVYGAGQVGNDAYAVMADRIAYYADGDMNKVGMLKNGIKIISVDEMLKQRNNYQILVAVGKEKIYELLHLLCFNGILECCVYQNLKF